MRVALVRAAAPMGFAGFLKRLGSPVERLMERSGLSPRTLEHPESLVPFAAALRFVTEAARTEGVDDLGLRAGRHMHLGEVGTFGRLLIGSSTVHLALEKAYSSFSFFNSGVRAWHTREGDEVHLHQVFFGVDPAHLPHWEGAVLSMYAQIVQLADPGWRPQTVQLSVADLPGWRESPLLANARLEFGRPALRLTLPARLLHRPFGARPPVAAPIDLEPWQRSGPANDFGGSVRQVVTALLADGYPDLRRVAEAAATSTRTLQRRLADEGLTYERVVAQARYALAQRLLQDPDRKVIEVALDLGYSDPAHFTRAFRGWTGLSPREFRQHLTQGGPAPTGS